MNEKEVVKKRKPAKKKAEVVEAPPLAVGDSAELTELRAQVARLAALLRDVPGDTLEQKITRLQANVRHGR